MFSNDLDQSLVFAVAFVARLFALLLVLAWLEQQHDVRHRVPALRVRLGRHRDGGDRAS